MGARVAKEKLLVVWGWTSVGDLDVWRILVKGMRQPQGL